MQGLKLRICSASDLDPSIENNMDASRTALADLEGRCATFGEEAPNVGMAIGHRG